MSFSKFAALASLLAATGSAQRIYDCDGKEQPNYDSCDRIIQIPAWDEIESPEPVPIGLCKGFKEGGDSGNCIIQACNYSDQPMHMAAFSGRSFYGIVKQYCEAEKAGGTSPIDSYSSIRVLNNPDWKPSAAKRSAIGDIVVELMTIEEADKQVEAAKKAEETQQADSALVKRYEKFTLYGVSKSIRQPGVKDQLTPAGDSSTSTTWETSQGYSSTVSASAGLSAGFFDIFSLSVDVGMEETYEESWSEGITVDTSETCGTNRAIVYLHPLFNKWTGVFDDSSDVATIWTPMKASDGVNYEYDTECLGKK